MNVISVFTFGQFKKGILKFPQLIHKQYTF